MVAMVTILFTVYCKLFHMMPYIIILKVRKFHQTTASRLSTARKKPVGGGHIVPPPSLNRVNHPLIQFSKLFNFLGMKGAKYFDFMSKIPQILFI